MDTTTLDDRDQYVRHLRLIGMTDREITDLIAEQDAEKAARAAAWDWEPADCECCEADSVEMPF